MSDAALKYSLVTIVFLIAILAAIRFYGRKLDNLFCDEKGKPAATKIGIVAAGGAWTYYMLVERPDSVEMWLAYYTAVALTDVFKKFITMWFQAKSGVRVEEETTMRADRATMATSRTTVTPTKPESDP